MRILQDALHEALHDLPEQVLTELITHKLSAQGVRLSARERELLIKAIREGKNTFYLKPWNWWENRRVTVDLTPQDIGEIERKFSDFLDNHLPELIQAATADLSRTVLADLKRKWRAESRQQRRDIAGFRKRLYKRWGSRWKACACCSPSPVSLAALSITKSGNPRMLPPANI